LLRYPFSGQQLLVLPQLTPPASTSQAIQLLAGQQNMEGHSKRFYWHISIQDSTILISAHVYNMR
jgi:hypothetical protein